MKTLSILTAAAACIAAGCSGAANRRQAFDAEQALAYCNTQVHRAMHQFDEAAEREGYDPDTFQETLPRNIAGTDSAWTCRPVSAAEWCSGFWPGILWWDYAANGDPDVGTAAEINTLILQDILDQPVFDHDLGFLFMCSAGTGYKVLSREMQRTDITPQQRTADSLTCQFFAKLLLRAADSLATLYRPNVGTMLSWPRNIAMFGGHNTIMDNMINLELLYWAAKHGGNPALADIATRHAETTMRHHFRPDFTSYHVAVYDTLDGHFLRGVTHQGLADSSMWARGQAWAVYGFTMVARETGDKRFLDHAQRVADVFLQRLPDDGVPYWDFSDPRIPTSPSHPAKPSKTVAPRDASAAAIVASALVELSTLVEQPDHADRYLQAAEHILASLSSQHYQARKRNAAFLLHSVGNHPKQSEVDVPIVYADYYYIEALNRYRDLARK